MAVYTTEQVEQVPTVAPAPWDREYDDPSDRPADVDNWYCPAPRGTTVR
jgi:hypothetical protein